MCPFYFSLLTLFTKKDLFEFDICLCPHKFWQANLGWWTTLTGKTTLSLSAGKDRAACSVFRGSGSSTKGNVAHRFSKLVKKCSLCTWSQTGKSGGNNRGWDGWRRTNEQQNWQVKDSNTRNPMMRMKKRVDHFGNTSPSTGCTTDRTIDNEKIPVAEKGL